MKKIFTLISILSLLQYGAMAKQSTVTDTGKAVLTFVNNDTLYDFGSLHVEDQAVNEFEIKNTGDANLVITGISCKTAGVACKCSKRTLKRGKTSIITVTYTAGDVTGSFDGDIMIASNSARGNARIHITGATVPTTAPIPAKASKARQGRGKGAR